MRRVEDNHPERLVIEWQIAKVCEDVKRPAIAENVLLATDIPEQNTFVFIVEVEHSRAGGRV